MRIKVHPGLCNGWGECHRWGREVYPLDADGMCEMRLLEVPPEYEDAARLGAMACPEQAITVIDDDPDAPRRFLSHLVEATSEAHVHVAGRRSSEGAPV
jgi:ferredoxin